MRFISLLLLFCFLTSVPGYCQFQELTAAEWVKKLGDENDRENLTARELVTFKAGMRLNAQLSKLNSERLYKFLPEIKKAGPNNNLYFDARIKTAEAMLLTNQNATDASSASNKEKVKQLMRDALRAAQEENDEYLLAYVTQAYFSAMKFYDETALAVMYGLYSTELYEKHFGISQFPDYQYLAELMYRVREYGKCIEYCKKWLALGKHPGSVEFETMKTFNLNTLALAYQRLQLYDSALYYYNEALAAEKAVHRKDWVGIISGNMGQVYYHLANYDTAKKLLELDYLTSMEYKYYDNAANSLQWAARVNLALGNKDKAIQQVRESIALIKGAPDQGYQQNIYYAAMQIYKKTGYYDSALHYFGLYQELHDTIEKKINLSSIAISKARLNEEKNFYEISKLQLEKKAQTQQRNFMITGIILLALLGLLLINRQRLKFKHREQNLQQENKLIEQEIAAAKKQMAMFTENIIQKSTLLEKLEQEVQQTRSSSEQQELINSLGKLTILTEADWDKFRQLFEKIYPLFFQKLKSKAADISIAEQRMAALTRLNLSSRHMASMQGVSIDTVHKTRQRLRQRLGISNDINMEEYFSEI